MGFWFDFSSRQSSTFQKLGRWWKHDLREHVMTWHGDLSSRHQEQSFPSQMRHICQALGEIYLINAYVINSALRKVPLMLRVIWFRPLQLLENWNITSRTGTKQEDLSPDWHHALTKLGLMHFFSMSMQIMSSLKETEFVFACLLLFALSTWEITINLSEKWNIS